MSIGYDTPLYILPFDHRNSYVAGIFHYGQPLTAEQRAAVADSKRVIYEGIKRAVTEGVPSAYAGILVDEEFGAEVLRDAAADGFVTATSTEKSGQNEFEFEYGADFAHHLEAVDPTFAKALVRYNPEGDDALNRRQTARLVELSDYCRTAGRRFMFELLVPSTDEQMRAVGGDKRAYDVETRPALMGRAMAELQDAGVEPDVWKLEGLDRREDCERIARTARRGGRDRVGCIVLGRGEEPERVTAWLETAAPVPGYIGFAVGRTSFWDAIADYEAKKVTREEAAARIARNYAGWVAIFERARSRPDGAR
jgi:myo-inositol catabolism protein IolC